MASYPSNSSDDIKDGTKTGIKAAKEIKNVASAVGKAAAGNYLGAAKDALKSEGFRAVAIFLVVCLSFSVFCATILFPMALYEGIKEALEQWLVDYYSGEGDRVQNFFLATGNMIADFVKRIVSNVDGAEFDQTVEADAHLTSNQEDLNAVYSRKIQAVKEKVTLRQDAVLKAIASDSVSSQIDRVMTDRFANEFGAAGVEFDIQYEPGTTDIASAKMYIFQPTEIIPIKRSIKDIEALQLLCLHTTKKNGDLSNVKLSAFLKWLGYNGVDNRQITFPLGDNDNILIKMRSWTGGFMPQYLEEEAAARGRQQAHDAGLSEEETEAAVETMTEKYEQKYGASIVDMLIQVDCPDLYSVPASLTEELKEDAGTATKWVTVYDQPGPDLYPAYYRTSIPDNFYEEWYLNGYGFTVGAYCEGVYGNYLYHRMGWERVEEGGSTYLQRTAINPKPEPQMRQVAVEYNYDITFIYVQYTIPITVHCRDVDDLLDMVGFWEGPLPWDAVSEAGSENEQQEVEGAA